MTTAWPRSRGLRAGLLAPFEEREAAWMSYVSGSRDVNTATVPIIQEMLDKQLTRATVTIKSTDDKAALVIPAVAAVAGLIGTNVSTDALKNPWMAGLLAFALVLGGLAIGFALVCIAPVWKRSNGPLPLPLTLGTGDGPILARVRIVNSLGFAVATAEEVVIGKAWWLNGSLQLGSVGGLCLLLFVGLGGLR